MPTFNDREMLWVNKATFARRHACFFFLCTLNHSHITTVLCLFWDLMFSFITVNYSLLWGITEGRVLEKRSSDSYKTASIQTSTNQNINGCQQTTTKKTTAVFCDFHSQVKKHNLWYQGGKNPLRYLCLLARITMAMVAIHRIFSSLWSVIISNRVVIVVKPFCDELACYRLLLHGFPPTA